MFRSAPLLIIGMMPFVADASEITDLTLLWKDGSYSEAATKLREYRKKPYGKTVRVDYMIATSLCRTGESAIGKRYFRSALHNYELSDKSRKIIKGEYSKCPVQTVPDDFPFVTASVRAGFSGKNFSLDFQRVGVAQRVKIERELTEKELLQRLIPVRGEKRKGAVKQVKDGIVRRLPDADVIEGKSFLIASVDGQQDLRSISDKLDKYLEFYLKFYKIRRPDRLITVYVTPRYGSKGAIRKLAKANHGIGLNRDIIGYSLSDDFSVSATLPRDGYVGTLAHELFHLLIRNDFGDVPGWLDEGTAALYEVSSIVGERAIPQSNWRAIILRHVKRKTRGFGEHPRPSIQALVSMNWKEFNAESADQDRGRKQQMVHHATARYFCEFLLRKGVLPDVLGKLREVDLEASDKTPAEHNIAVLKLVLGKSLDEVESEFTTWLATKTE